MKKEKTKLSKTNGMSLEDLDFALTKVEEIFERAMIPFVLLGETARSVIEKDQVDGNKIEVGILRRHLQETAKSILDIVLPGFKEKGGKIEFMVDEVPVEVKIIEKKYKYFERPDRVFYKITQYCIPNPFGRYWEVRGMIK